ncbi:MAG: hypothetical protein KKF62_09310 [Bacteroidetes bacterium]|nr:hypothetical protein [Bacteroidota bacterium]MBU1116736.1 hypothetical protein [Bacteroidota bacterium]MBU1798135.1 hypothetical protein [Bacteroidota bacterium]
MKPKTLCEWNKTDIKENKEIIITLAKTPNLYCKKCARISNDENYLCKPEKIK